MNKLMSVLGLVVLVAMLHSSCQVLPTKATPASETLTAVIDSNVFTATSASAYLSGSQLVIKGTTAQNVSITVTLQTFAGYTGQTAIDNYACFAAIDSGTGAGPRTSLINTGAVTITETYPYIKGTFYFLCNDSSVVSHGQFNLIAPTR
jgi:hypothetical protein